MRREKHPNFGLTALLVLASVFVSVSARLAVMSIDLGGEYMKIAIVKPGVPMEVVLNKESSRKTPTLVAFRDGERHFASQAQSTALKFPQKAFGYLMQIIGRHYDDPQVQLYRERFPYYNMLKDEERGTVVFKIDEETEYTPEELLGMILEKAREYAQDFAEQEIKDAVITVPPFYNQAERRAVMNAANLVGINVLQLMSDNAAVALNYGVFRRKNFNSTTQYYMFYDMGSTSTTATIVGYNVVKTKEGTIMESNPQLTIKGIGFDRTLGGLEFTLRLRSHLAKVFNDQKKTTLKVEENNRAMAKLLKESERVKKVLSANVDHHAQVENLLDEKDFRAGVTRAELEEMTHDLTDRVIKPIEEALKVSEITLPEISEVILMGGGTRMPKVQDILLKYLGRTELGKSINTDEAAALGAVYQAAYLGKGFKVKKFGVREGNIYPINVEFERQKSEEDGGAEKSKTVKRTLFGRMNPYPQKKVMTFNKHSKDFSFNVMYSSLDFLTEDDRRSFGSPLISKYTLIGVEDALNKNKDKAEPKGIKAHFQMDGSGILTLDRVESVFEMNNTDSGEEKSAWSKLSSTIGGFFGGGSSDDEPKVEESQETPTDASSTGGSTEETVAEGEGGDADAAAAGGGGGSDGDEKKKAEEETGKEETAEKDDTKKDDPPEAGQESEGQKEETEEETKEEEGKKEEEKEEEKTEETEKPKEEEKKEESESNEKKESESKEEEKASNKTEKESDKKETKDTAPKIVNIKEVIKSEVEVLDMKEISEDKFKAAKKRLSELRKADKARMDLEMAKNELEAFIFDLQDKLGQGPFEKCSTEEEREKIFAELSSASDWLYDESDEAKKSDFNDKLKALRDSSKDIAKRVYEMEERPKALDALKGALNQTTVFLETVKNLTDIEDPIFTQVELETLEKLINETREWRNQNVAEQKKLKPYENPSLLTQQIGEKIQALDREMRYLINKAKNFKPKAKPKEEKKKKEENTTETETESTTTKTPEEDQEAVPPTEETKSTPDEGEKEQKTKAETGDAKDADAKDASEEKTKSDSADADKTEADTDADKPATETDDQEADTKTKDSNKETEENAHAEL